MKSYLIDPIRKLVRTIHHSGTPEGVAKAFQDYHYNIVKVSAEVTQVNKHGDYVTHNTQPASSDNADYCWHYFCSLCNTNHCFFGPGIITGSIGDDSDSLEEPMYSIRAYKEMVQWGYVEEGKVRESVPEGITFIGSVDEFLEWLEGSDGKSVQ